ncbi:hypothetical protein ACQJBY_056268 [Aegilops geniculata]
MGGSVFPSLFFPAAGGGQSFNLSRSHAQPIFKRDLEWCPKFDKLKTLKLNDWFTTTDLVCILQHSPNLEKLTLKIDFPENFVGGDGSRQSFVCLPHLVVNIKCRKVDTVVHKILDVLRTCGILLEQIVPSTDWD